MTPSSGTDAVRILVVDDHRLVRRALVRLLRSNTPYTVEAASSGREAKQMLSRKSYALVISDRDLGDMTGEALFTSVREMLSTSTRPKWLFITGNIEPAVHARLRALAPLLKKPFDSEELLDALSTALSSD